MFGMLALLFGASETNKSRRLRSLPHVGKYPLKHNPLIAGWRGLSVLCVIIGHYVGHRFSGEVSLRPLHDLMSQGLFFELIQNVAFRITASLGEIGVQFFFVISGFLITQLLDAEENKNGSISLGAFYIRRIFRIVPAFWCYLLAVWLLRLAGLIHLDNEAFLRSGAFLCNISGFKCSWWLAHTWSLSVEEQFYVIWPCIFIIVGKKYRRASISLILAALLVAAIFVPDLSSFANIAAGALLALSSGVRQLILRYSSPGIVLGSVLLLLIHPLISPRWHLESALTFVTPLVIAFVFFATVNKNGPVQRILSAYPVQKLGLISYSAYLWQQLSAAPILWGGHETGAAGLYSDYPLATWLFLVPAAILFFLIEAPMQTIGRKLSNRIIATADDDKLKQRPVMLATSNNLPKLTDK
jgi:peptidoglycan/LPS O-acetylase OafA/YrhL